MSKTQEINVNPEFTINLTILGGASPEEIARKVGEILSAEMAPHGPPDAPRQPVAYAIKEPGSRKPYMGFGKGKWTVDRSAAFRCASLEDLLVYVTLNRPDVARWLDQEKAKVVGIYKAGK